MICSIYIGASIVWWFVFRHLRSVWCLSLPFFLYGLAFFLVGLSVLPPLFQRRYWLGNVGTGFYAAASASGSLYFALNPGDGGGGPAKDWVYRACIFSIERVFPTTPEMQKGVRHVKSYTLIKSTLVTDGKKELLFADGAGHKM